MRQLWKHPNYRPFRHLSERYQKKGFLELRWLHTLGRVIITALFEGCDKFFARDFRAFV